MSFGLEENIGLGIYAVLVQLLSIQNLFENWKPNSPSWY